MNVTPRLSSPLLVSPRFSSFLLVYPDACISSPASPFPDNPRQSVSSRDASIWINEERRGSEATFDAEK